MGSHFCLSTDYRRLARDNPGDHVEGSDCSAGRLTRPPNIALRDRVAENPNLVEG